jgi:cation diffusion facilitator family transporter
LNKIRALKLSLLAISTVVFCEAIAGALVNSLAILSDAAHAAFDVVTTLILLATTRWSLKPPDEEHTYGHEKIESIGGLIGGLILVVLAAILIFDAGLRLVSIVEIKFSPIGFVAVVYTLCVDFFRIGILSRTTEKGSITVRANLYHAFADFASTVIALVGFYLATIGISQGDAAASIILALLLIYLSVRLIRVSSMELSDAIPKTTVQFLQREIMNTHGVLGFKELKVRKAGDKFFVEVNVLVAETLDLQEAHDIASSTELNIRTYLGEASVTIHVEPTHKEDSLENKVKSLASMVEGVKGVHNVSSYYTEGNLRLTLHIQVDGSLSLEQAHEIAEETEQSLRRNISSATEITIHIEPFDRLKINKRQRPLKISVEEAVQQAISKQPTVFDVKSITTYLKGGKRHLNIVCSFDKKHSVDTVHSIVSDIERELRKQFKETIVTIHAEPSNN